MEQLRKSFLCLSFPTPLRKTYSEASDSNWQSYFKTLALMIKIFLPCLLVSHTLCRGRPNLAFDCSSRPYMANTVILHHRYKLKFSPDKVDTMIVQAIALLDDLDKEINIYAMRVKVGRHRKCSYIVGSILTLFAIYRNGTDGTSPRWQRSSQITRPMQRSSRPWASEQTLPLPTSPRSYLKIWKRSSKQQPSSPWVPKSPRPTCNTSTF